MEPNHQTFGYPAESLTDLSFISATILLVVLFNKI